MILCEQKFNWIITFFYAFLSFSLVSFDYFHHIVNWTFVGFVGCFLFFSENTFLRVFSVVQLKMYNFNVTRCRFSRMSIWCVLCVCLRCFLQIDLLVPVFWAIKTLACRRAFKVRLLLLWNSHPHFVGFHALHSIWMEITLKCSIIILLFCYLYTLLFARWE